MTLQPLPDADPEEAFRFMAKIFEYGDHWLWTGQSTIISRKYIQFVFQSESAVQYAYKAFRSSVPLDGYLRRTCRQVFCVNPWHYKPGKLKGPSRGFGERLHCSAGHEYTEGSYVMRERKKPNGDTYSTRDCLECCRIRAKKRYSENREAYIERSSENYRKKKQLGKDACSAGHEYVEGSYRLREKISSNGRPFNVRVCRHCEARNNRVRREKKKSAPQPKETRA